MEGFPGKYKAERIVHMRIREKIAKKYNQVKVQGEVVEILKEIKKEGVARDFDREFRAEDRVRCRHYSDIPGSNDTWKWGNIRDRYEYEDELEREASSCHGHVERSWDGYVLYSHQWWWDYRILVKYDVKGETLFSEIECPFETKRIEAGDQMELYYDRFEPQIVKNYGIDYLPLWLERKLFG